MERRFARVAGTAVVLLTATGCWTLPEGGVPDGGRDVFEPADTGGGGDDLPPGWPGWHCQSDDECLSHCCDPLAGRCLDLCVDVPPGDAWDPDLPVADARGPDGDDDTADAPFEACGDRAQYASCNAALEADACAAAGGWITTGPFGEVFCECPTGDGGCPCDEGADCAYLCLVDDSSCLASHGTCSDTNAVFGCTCVLDHMQPGPAWICFD